MAADSGEFGALQSMHAYLLAQPVLCDRIEHHGLRCKPSRPGCSAPGGKPIGGEQRGRAGRCSRYR